MRRYTPAIVALALSAGAGTLIAQRIGDWPDPVANHVIPYQTAGITVGPMLGRPEADSVRVWMRTDDPKPFDVVYDTALPLDEESLSVTGRTLTRDDNTGYVDLKDLRANTRYYYGIRIRDYIVDTRVDFDDPWPSFRTLPDASTYRDTHNNPDGLFNLRFSVGHCLRQRTPIKKDNFGIYSDPPVYRTLFKEHGEELHFNILNGDLTYEETLDGTLEGYRKNYRLYLERGRNVSRLFRYIPSLFTYDDHEVNSNLDGSGEIGLGDGDYLVRDLGLSVWDQYAAWANYDSEARGAIRFGTARMEQGSDILRDPKADFSNLKPAEVSTIHIGNYIKKDGRSKEQRGGGNIGVYGLVEVIDRHSIRVMPKFRATSEGSYSIGTHHYYDKKIGNSHFFFLDMRGERSRFIEDRTHDADRFILGDTQREWLLDGARNTDAEFIFIISSVPWTLYHSAYHVDPSQGWKSKGDGFCGYVHERERILPVLDKIEKPVLVFTGDLHCAFATQITDNVWEFMVGPLNSSGHPAGTAGLTPFGGWFDSEGRTVKIKWAGTHPDNVFYSRLRNTYYAVVSVNNVLPAARPQGAGYQLIAYDEPQVVVQFYDGYTGQLVYAEGISTMDAKTERKVAPRESRWPSAFAPTRER